MSKVWFITGCSSGLGAALADAALRAGHRVVVTARELTALNRFSNHPDCLRLAYDVAGGDARAALADAVKWAGKVDVLVNNAGYALLGALEDTSDEEAARCMEVNFFGAIRLMRAAAPHFREQNGGMVVNVSAAAAIANYPGFSIYGAAKAALEAASESYRLEMAPWGVKVMLVQPGPFRTAFISKSLKRTASTNQSYDSNVGKFSTMLTRMDGKQVGDPSKAAEVIVRLATGDRVPLRLVLGTYAKKKTRDTLAARLRELEEQDGSVASTEFTP